MRCDGSASVRDGRMSVYDGRASIYDAQASICRSGTCNSWLYFSTGVYPLRPHTFLGEQLLVICVIICGTHHTCITCTVPRACATDGRTDGPTDARRMNGQMEGRMDDQTGGQTDGTGRDRTGRDARRRRIQNDIRQSMASKSKRWPWSLSDDLERR